MEGRRRAVGTRFPVAQCRDREAVMEHPESYELIFQAAAVDDVVVVRRTDRTGPGGHPIYEDETGIVRAEVSGRGEVRMLASGGHQAHELPVIARTAQV
ncbi:hypothetical protein RKD30_006940 [Streptomyces pristinaespiralis]|jgi:hypothetical protein|uniref:Predicted protein n=3 Tax=Streptomyces pristinaespiralis TaxID=38300 RepID=D6X675_STRE2|nr:hypothetical protein SPRI_0493 [Streptomyces pristinaespiralis]EFH30582.1 predicted protein [Streptomyces pristinaespiralis ATCC 25486]